MMSNSTFLIKSRENRSFGTGFCIHKDEKGSFLLTAAHVVESCNKKALLVESHPAKLLYISDEKDTIDLALIYVEGLLDSTPLKLSDEVAQEGDTFTIVGYRPHKDDYAKEPLKGAIKKAYTLESKEHKRDIYELTINDGDSIEQGYSGSAVVSSVTGLVVAIATDRKTNGRQAYATPARYLREIWKELPEDIFESFNDNNPYKGLNSFEYKDRHNYYGREKESKEIVERLKTTRLFTLLGASGSGKSSLIYAGIVPLIEGDEVEILSFRPLSEPFKNLASVFIPTLYPDKLEQIEQSEKLTKKLINSDIKLDNLVQRFLEDSKSKHLYLIIDQFEELFTLTKEQEHQNQFLDQLLTLINSELNVTLLISMRADFLSHISFYEPFNKAYNDHPSQMLSLLSHENLKRIIEEPAKKQGVTFQDGLVDRIIEEIEHEAGQLPLLEFALEQFWTNKKGRVISHAVLDEMQSISHSISHYADKIYKSHPKYQSSIEKVLIKLVNPGSGTEDTRRIASLDEFDKEARETITLLANERLVITEDGNIDIIHEALIREWQRLQEWINKYRNFLEWEKHLRDDRKFYMDNGEKREDLLKDSKLMRAKEFLESHSKYIAPLDKEFLEESVKVANKKKRNRVIFISSLFLFLLGVIGVVSYFWKDAQNQKEVVQNMLYDSRVEEGIIYRDYLSEPLKSKFIFSNLIKDSTTQEQEGNAKILYASTNQNNIVLTNLINETFLYQTGNQLITYKGKVVNVWDINTEKIVQTFHSSVDIDIAKFNKDKSIIFIVGDNNITSWSVSSGKLLHVFESNITTTRVDMIVLNSNETKLFIKRANILEVWDISSGKLLKRQEANNISMSMDRSRISLLSKNRVTKEKSDRIEVWDMDNLESLWSLNRKIISNIWLNKDGSKLFYFYYRGDYITVIDATSGEILEKIKLSERSWQTNFIFTSDEKKVILWNDKVIKIFDIKNGKLLQKIIMWSSINKVIFNKNETEIITTHSNGNINFWNIKRGKQLNRLKDDYCYQIVLSPDGTKLISFLNNSFKFWNVYNKKNITLANRYVRLYKDKKMFLSCSINTCNVLDITTGKVIRSFLSRIKWNEIVFNSNETRVLLLGKNTFEFWDITNNKFLQNFEHIDVKKVEFNKDETQVLSLSYAKKNNYRKQYIKIWSLKDGRLIKEFIIDSLMDDIHFYDNRSILIVNKGQMKILDINSGQSKQLSERNSWLWSFKFNKDKSKILLAYISSMRLVDIQTNEVIKTFNVKDVMGAIFNNDESRILCWNSNGIIQVLDVYTGKVLQTLHHIDVKGAIWNEKENKVLSWGYNSVKLWNISTSQLLLSLLFKEDTIREVVFSNDERKIYFLCNNLLNKYILYPKTNIDKRYYPLKTEVEKGVSLTPLGELKMMDRKEWIEKKEKYNKIINTSPKFKEIIFQKNENFYYKGNDEYNKEQYKEAIISYKKALKKNPRYYKIYVALGDVYFAKGEKSLARENYEKAIKRNSNSFEIMNWTSLNNLLDIYYNKKEYILVKKILQERIDIYPQNDMSYLNLLELELIENQAFNQTLKKKYIELFKNKKETFIYYEMLKIFQSIVNGKDVDLERWKKRYHGIVFNWSFNELDFWLENMEDSKKKSKLEEALKFFKQHQKENKKESK